MRCVVKDTVRLISNWDCCTLFSVVRDKDGTGGIYLCGEDPQLGGEAEADWHLAYSDCRQGGWPLTAAVTSVVISGESLSVLYWNQACMSNQICFNEGLRKRSGEHASFCHCSCGACQFLSCFFHGKVSSWICWNLQIYVEIERARLTRTLAKIREDQGNISEAATILQELQVETFGSMEKKEKVEFILEQMRLCLAKKDHIRTQIISKKISQKYFEEKDSHVSGSCPILVKYLPHLLHNVRCFSCWHDPNQVVIPAMKSCCWISQVTFILNVTSYFHSECHKLLSFWMSQVTFILNVTSYFHYECHKLLLFSGTEVEILPVDDWIGPAWVCIPINL